MNKEIEKAIETIKHIKLCTKDTNRDEYLNDVKTALKLAITALEQQNNGGWIQVSERLPEKNKIVLIYAMSLSRGGCIYTIGSCSNKCWFTESGLGLLSYPNGNNYEALSWMPLPVKPWKEEQP